MSGKIDLVAVLVPTVSAIAIVTDLWKGRIYNWLTLPALLTGLILALTAVSRVGFESALLGAGLGLLMFSWMFLLGVMGGGDVKLLMALGAIGGAKFVVETAVVSVLVGGAMAVVYLLAQGKLKNFLSRMGTSLVFFIARESPLSSPMIDKKSKMPFGIPIGIAAVWVLYGEPLKDMGIRLWS